MWNSSISCERVFKTSLGNCFLSILSSELQVTELLAVLEIDLFGGQPTNSKQLGKKVIDNEIHGDFSRTFRHGT